MSDSEKFSVCQFRREMRQSASGNTACLAVSEERCVIMANPLRCYRHSGLVMYFSTLPAPSASAPCILAILTHLRVRVKICILTHHQVQSERSSPHIPTRKSIRMHMFSPQNLHMSIKRLNFASKFHKKFLKS